MQNYITEVTLTSCCIYMHHNRRQISDFICMIKVRMCDVMHDT